MMKLLRLRRPATTAAAPPRRRRRSRPPKNFRTAHAAVKVSQSKACATQAIRPSAK